MNIKHLLLPAALAGTFALGVYTSQPTKQLLTKTYTAIDHSLEQHTSIGLPDLPSYSPSPQPNHTSPTIAPTISTYKSISSAPTADQLQQTITQLQLENQRIRQTLLKTLAETPAQTAAAENSSVKAPNYYSPRPRELSAHDFAQPFLMNFADHSHRFLSKYLDSEQQALNLYNQIANNLDILSPDQRRDLAIHLEHNDTRWLTPEQKTQRLYHKTKQSLAQLPKDKLQSLDETLHAISSLEPAQSTALSPSLLTLPYLANIITALLPSNTTYHNPTAPQPPSPTAPLPLPTSISPTTAQPPPDYDKIISQQIEQQIAQQIEQQLNQKLDKKIGKQVQRQLGTKIKQTGNCRIDKLELNVNAESCQEPSPLPAQHSPVDLNKDQTPTK